MNDADNEFNVPLPDLWLTVPLSDWSADDNNIWLLDSTISFYLPNAWACIAAAVASCDALASTSALTANINDALSYVGGGELKCHEVAVVALKD